MTNRTDPVLFFQELVVQGDSGVLDAAFLPAALSDFSGSHNLGDSMDITYEMLAKVQDEIRQITDEYAAISRDHQLLYGKLCTLSNQRTTLENLLKIYTKLKTA